MKSLQQNLSGKDKETTIIPWGEKTDRVKFPVIIPIVRTFSLLFISSSSIAESAVNSILSSLYADFPLNIEGHTKSNSFLALRSADVQERRQPQNVPVNELKIMVSKSASEDTKSP
ncbi:hypothetical protein NPIL_45431 [Nephila pilipes]|uniref:Uncharacterized protein n=1 Tax=Nephila pilipes TaxID=299642 RepID=A0A8X6TT98_NEPPI|nr:hypothetical protein NPIL_45431 [Nephila pilipes]